MSQDLMTQLAEYGTYCEQQQSSVTADELLGGPLLHPVADSHTGPRRWVWAAAAVIVGLLVGGVAWWAQGTSSDVINQPTITTSIPTKDLVVAGVVDIGSPFRTKTWGTDRIISAGGALWVGTDNRDLTNTRDASGPSRLLRLATTSAEITDEIELPRGVVDLVADDEFLWALVADDTVVGVDLETREVTSTIQTTLGIGDWDSSWRSDLYLVAGGLWVAGGDGVARVDLETLSVERFTMPVGEGDDGPLPVDMWIGVADGALWGLNSHDNYLIAIDLESDEVTKWLADTGAAESIALMGDGAIWVGYYTWQRFDIETRTATAFGSPGPGWSTPVNVYADGGVWTVPSDPADPGSLYRLDAATGTAEEVLPIPDRVHAVAGFDGSIWVSTQGPAGELIQIDMRTRQVIARVPIGAGGDLVSFGGAIWIAAENGTVAKVAFQEPTETTSAVDDTTATTMARDSVPVVRSAGQIEERIPSALWAEDHIVATNDVLWVGSQDLSESTPTGALYVIDPTTAAITDRIPVGGGVADLLVDGDVLWVLTGDGDLHRTDASSGRITGTLTITCPVDDCFWYGRSDLRAAGDGVWLTSDSDGDLGQWRIDPASMSVEVVEDKGGVRYDLNDDGSAEGVTVDRIGSGAAMWLGEANGLLWSLSSHDGWIVGLDTETGTRVAYEMHTLAQVDAHESSATLVGDDIWMVPCCSRTVVRFDTETRDVETIPFSGGWHARMADGALWIAGENHIERLDVESGIVTDSLTVDALKPRSVAVDQTGALWVSGETVVIRIDPQTRRISDRIELGSGGQLLAAHGGVWIAAESGLIFRIDEG